MFIIKELKNVGSSSALLSYEVIGYVDTYGEAYQYCAKGKKYTINDDWGIAPGKTMEQYTFEEVKPLVPQRNDTTINPFELEVVEIMVDLTFTQPKDFVGSLFKNSSGVFNIPDNIEDVVKSNQWFGNIPVNLYLTTKENPSIDEWGIDKNGVIRFYKDLNFITKDVRKILMTTNPAVKLPFTKEMLNALKGTTDAKILKTLYVAEEMKGMKASIDKQYDHLQKKIASDIKPEPKPQKWTTFDGKQINVSDIDHQHLSNIYWYNLIVYGKPSETAVKELNKRFQGEILNYHPLLRFKQEIEYLETHDLLTWYDNGSYYSGYIKYDNKLIGAIKKLK